MLNSLPKIINYKAFTSYDAPTEVHHRARPLHVAACSPPLTIYCLWAVWSRNGYDGKNPPCGDNFKFFWDQDKAVPGADSLGSTLDLTMLQNQTAAAERAAVLTLHVRDPLLILPAWLNTEAMATTHLCLYVTTARPGEQSCPLGVKFLILSTLYGIHKLPLNSQHSWQW